MTIGRIFFVIGCLSAAFGVAAGAFGAHGLKAILKPELLVIYETAVRYQMYHAFGLLATGLVTSDGANTKLRIAGWCFVAGTIFFSGSLYLLVLTEMRWLGAVTPFGGIAFIAGWVMLGLSAFQRKATL